MTAPIDEPQPPSAVGRASVAPISPAPSAGRVRASAPLPANKTRPPKKKGRRRNRIIAWVAATVLVAGIGLIAGTYFYDTVPKPDELTLKNSTEVLDKNGVIIARLGLENRAEVSMDKLAEPIQRALVAGEDKNFWEHHGIDPWGIARAAWNNVTGGELQGASTITQQYARHAAADMEISYGRKLREAVMARKLEDDYSKKDILGFYLNTVYFGRGTYGIGAAAKAYFNIEPENIDKMTVAEAAVLGAVLRQPEPEQGGDQGYDPHYNPGAALDRWKYVLGNMLEKNWLSQSERDSMTYPKVETYDPAKNTGETGYTDRGTGQILKYVEKELGERGVLQWLKDQKLGSWKSAGLRITTTIDPLMQEAIEVQMDRTRKNSVMSKQRDNIVGAVVSINPANGRVLGYYGGTNNGTEIDWAKAQHEPASSFKIYTLAAAINERISVDSRWDPTELKTSKGDKWNVGNANHEGDQSCGKSCTLQDMTVKSYNVPFFKIANEIGPDKVVSMAHKAGVQTMWNDAGKAFNLKDGIPGQETFGPWVGFGQYPITVLDHAAGTATIANHGVRNTPHFMVKVERKNRQTGKWEHMPMGDEKPTAVKAIEANVADEVTGVLKRIPGSDEVAGEGRDSAGKTGTWENGLNKKANSGAWFTGYTAQVVTTVWLGSKDGQKTPIKLTNNQNMGSSFARDIWKLIMDKAHRDMKLEPKRLPSIKGIGDDNKGDGAQPTPTLEPTKPPASPDPTTVPEPTPTTGPTGKPTPQPTKTNKP